MMDSRLEAPLAPAAAPPAAVKLWAAPLMGAELGPGGWLVVAPGTPEGGPGVPPLLLSETCWLRITLESGAWLGLCDSEVDSVCEKSNSADTWALTFPCPT